MRPWSTLLVGLSACLLTLCPMSAWAQQADVADQADPPKLTDSAEPATTSTKAATTPDPRVARDLAAEALTALRAGEAARAAELWQRASAAAPDEPSLRFNRGVALEAAGDRRGAVDAYEDALSAGRAGSDDTASRSQFNLAALELEQAWGARDLMQMGGDEWKAALREQLAAGGGPDAQMSDEEIAARSEQLRIELAEKGVESARSATKRLRDLIRTDPSDRDVATNLELAQRTVRELREELEKQQKQQDKDDAGDKGDEESDEEDEQDDQDKQQDNESGGDQQKKQDEQDKQDGDKQDGDDQDDQEKPEDTQDGSDEKKDQNEQPEASQDEAEKKPSDARQAKAEKMLEELLDAAARRADEVRKLRAARARRAPVERDW